MPVCLLVLVYLTITIYWRVKQSQGIQWKTVVQQQVSYSFPWAGISSYPILIQHQILSLRLKVKVPYDQNSCDNIFQPPNNIPDPNMKTLLLWTSWFGTDWYIGRVGYSWDGQKHTDLRDFGCDEESYKCTITTNR